METTNNYTGAVREYLFGNGFVGEIQSAFFPDKTPEQPRYPHHQPRTIPTLRSRFARLNVETLEQR
jgi:hypothetical protein